MSHLPKSHTPTSSQSPEERERLRIEAEKLFSSIEAEFGIHSPRAKRKKPSTALRSPTPPRSPADAALHAHLTESNKLALLMDSPTWKPIAISHYIIQQKCLTCDSLHEYIGGVLIRHQKKNSPGDIWEYPRPFLPQFEHLPRIIHEVETQTPLCAQCLRAPASSHSIDSEIAAYIEALNDKRRADALDLAEELSTSDETESETETEVDLSDLSDE